MSRRATVVDRATAMYHDTALDHVRAWLDRDPRRRACGYLPVYAPREIIAAAGMLPVGIHGGGDRVEIIRGDAYYQSYICHLPRSVIELLLSGRLDALSAFLFPSTCDVIRNLSGMFKLLRPDRYVRYLDVPQVRDTRGEAFWDHELRIVLRDLAELAGTRPADDDVRQAIAAYGVVRGHVRALYALRLERPWDVPTEELYVLLRAAEQLPAEDAATMLAEYRAAAVAEPGRPRDNVRVVVEGAFCEQPPLGLVRTLERAGCYVVDDDFLVGNRLLGDVPVDGDPIRALAHAFVTGARPTSVLYEPDPHAKRALVAARARAARADGVVFAAPSFCDPALLDRPMLKDGADAAKVPCIAFNYAENTGQFQQYREQAGTFSDALKLWGTT